MPGGGGPSCTRLAAVADLSDDAVGLVETALLLSPSADEDGDHRAMRALDQLAALLGPLESETVTAQADRLADTLFQHFRFTLDMEDDDSDFGNACLRTALTRRRATPEMLGLVAVEIMRRGGGRAHMLALPAHPLVRLEDAQGERVIVDPALRGGPVSVADIRAMLKGHCGNDAELSPAFFLPLSNRDCLVRLQNSLKIRLLRFGHVEQALEVVERILAFAPGQIPLWREAGLMRLRLGDLPGATAALEYFIHRSPPGQTRSRTLTLLAELRARLT